MLATPTFAIDELPKVGRPPEPVEEKSSEPKEPKQSSEPIVPRDYVVVPRVGQYGRRALHLDPVQHAIAKGEWKPPKAGDRLELPTGTSRTWEKREATDAGQLSDAALRGGYASTIIDSPEKQIRLLQARGHGAVYVNGVPRVGDPYNTGWINIPVALRKGKNELLFHIAGGDLRAKLVVPPEDTFFDLRDSTMPDVIRGNEGPYWGSLLVVNATAKPLTDVAIEASIDGGKPAHAAEVQIAPLSVRKVGFRFDVPKPGDGEHVDLGLRLVRKKKVLDTQSVKLTVVGANEPHNRTFVSEIDGSVQYYAVQPAAKGKPKQKAKPGLMLALHGASVEASGLANHYSAKPWAHVVVPTNRRPYGFDWEDWGRLDALEVLEDARAKLATPERRTWLTGHSMGGHGTWLLGATYPDRFAAIGPSAGWISFFSYGGMKRYSGSQIDRLLGRATSPSDTRELLANLAEQGVYILHGTKDNNVPVDQARTMRRELATFHRDFAYFEKPDAGHWWGSECVDWQPMMQFLQRHAIPSSEDLGHIEFITANPRISSDCHWVSILAQERQLEQSRIDISVEPDERRFVGFAENVARLSLDVTPIGKPGPLEIQLDGQVLKDVPWPKEGDRLWLALRDDTWVVASQPLPGPKGPHRYGLFKDGFRNRMIFVYGTRGSEEENAWALDKARYDAETFWYRGNGSIDVMADHEFDAASDVDRNVILYGNADTNGAWSKLLGKSPVQVRRGEVQVGTRPESGDDLACLLVRPRPGSDTAMVAAVAGTGIAGMRATDRLPYFVSGTAYPDLMVFGADALVEGTDEIRVLGFFGLDWSLENGEFAWRDLGL